MTEPQFVHLRLHSEYSIEDGILRIDEAVQKAVEDTQPALALTDLANLFGMVKFYKEAREKGIKPIVGCDVWVRSEEMSDPFRLLLLVKNRRGYAQLCRLLSQSQVEKARNQSSAEVRVKWLETLAQEGMDLIALSGFQAGDIGVAISQGKLDWAERFAQRWARVFPDSFYIEIQRPQHPGVSATEQTLRQMLALADKLSLPVVATHPVQFLEEKDFAAHDARVCIARGEVLASKRRPQLFCDQQYFLSQQEMLSRFADLPGALQNTVEIAKRCNLTLGLGELHLPHFRKPDGELLVGEALDTFLEQEAQAGLESRLEQMFSPDERAKARPRYEERLRFEIDTIIKMGYSGYFLIVSDFIQWAKDRGIPVGPGRGSGAGSLVAYALSITNLDPLAYNLLFERFLNPERVSMPDFDIDFCTERRGEVIDYVKRRYGDDAVSQIVTFHRMKAKAAVRDVGRVLDLGYNFCDGIAKLIPRALDATIESAREAEPRLAKREEEEEEVAQLLALAEQIEDITREAGTHAGGVLIAPGRLTDFCPLYSQEDRGIVAQLDMEDIGEIGLVKFDFLGLATLTILSKTLENIRAVRQDDPAAPLFTLESIPLDDRQTYDLLTSAKTVAVFQLESAGMRNMLRQAKPDRFEDIIALVAMFRPGPMEHIPDFCRRKHGEPFDYPDPRAEVILSETYGIMVYQEQVMQMAQVLGGYSLGGADLLRRAMGKKDPVEMAKQRKVFQEGAAKNGLSAENAGGIFDEMEKFAGYGFNKSHAAAYALLAYQTAYLKVHYPAEFMAANMSLAMNDTEKMSILVRDAQQTCGLEILPPDISRSAYPFLPVAFDPSNGSATKIRYGLGAVKGVGEGAIENIIGAREEKLFADLFDFCQRVDKQRVARDAIKSLICAGALDFLGKDRAVLLESLSLAIEVAKQANENAEQGSLFDGDDVARTHIAYVNVPDWSLRDRLDKEKSALGLHLSGHLFHLYAEEARHFGHTPVAELRKHRTKRWVAGILSFWQEGQSRLGPVMTGVLDDGTGMIDVVMYAENVGKYKPLFVQDAFLVVSGRVEERRNGDGLRVMVDEIMDIVAARCHIRKQLHMELPEEYAIETLKTQLSPYVSHDGLPLFAYYRNKSLQCELDLGDAWRLLPSDECLHTLQMISNAQVS
ncbi:MAG: DNA polymerase III subunit alpha [Burkholderiaceae bacterium]|jgi:DNA polymerase-3 subunit alpha|nr:DNA polymerase III subunit alpha [Burkholderiaceae bacterium]